MKMDSSPDNAFWACLAVLRIPQSSLGNNYRSILAASVMAAEYKGAFVEDTA